MDRKGYRTISAMASDGFINGHLNWEDSLVQMASSKLQKDPTAAGLGFNTSKMLE